jgi:hypothetical protein
MIEIYEQLLYTINGEDAQLVANEDFGIKLTLEQIKKLSSIVYKYIDHDSILKLAINELLEKEGLTNG